MHCLLQPPGGGEVPNASCHEKDRRKIPTPSPLQESVLFTNIVRVIGVFLRRRWQAMDLEKRQPYYFGDISAYQRKLRSCGIAVECVKEKLTLMFCIGQCHFGWWLDITALSTYCVAINIKGWIIATLKCTLKTLHYRKYGTQKHLTLIFIVIGAIKIILHLKLSIFLIKRVNYFRQKKIQ